MVPRVFALLVVPMALAAQGEIVTQSSTVQGVTVAATAGNLSEEAPVWDFAVVLDSRDRALPDDVAANAVLLDANGQVQRALIWEGAPAEGRHRAGVLKFIALNPRPDWVELRITRPGEAKPRVFSWLLPGRLVASR